MISRLRQLHRLCRSNLLHMQAEILRVMTRKQWEFFHMLFPEIKEHSRLSDGWWESRESAWDRVSSLEKGRAEDMDVVIRGDLAVARHRHACVIFEPRAGIFYAQPGESHELFYLNDNVVLNSEILKDHDVITLGETSLMFIPLCGPDFSWDKYRKKEMN